MTSDPALMKVLLVEDNPLDVRLMREVLDGTRLPYRLEVASAPQHALTVLRGDGKTTPAIHPDLVLLDLSIPRQGGRELLIEIKCDPLLRRIPVMVLAAAAADADFLAAYEEYTHCFMPKPTNLDRFVALVQALRDFWLKEAIPAVPSATQSI